MPFNRPTIKEIYARVISDLESRINNRTTQASAGAFQVKLLKISLLGIITTVFAGAVHMLYGYLVYLSKQLLPDTAEGDWLIRYANLYGYPQKAATYSEGFVNFTGTNGGVIALGTELQDENGIQYATTEAATIASGVANNVPVKALLLGTAGNSTASSLELITPLANVNSTAIVVSGLDTGVNLETIEELRARLLRELRAPVTGGRAEDYETWALSVPGVYSCWCLDTYMGPSTVGVVIAGENGSEVSSQIIADCAAYIETKRPLGIHPDVLSVDVVTFAFTIAIPASTDSAVRTQLNDNVQSLFIDEAAPGGTILLSHLNSALITSGVSDYSITAITKNGASYPVGNIVTTGIELAKLGTITLTDL